MAQFIWNASRYITWSCVNSLITVQPCRSNHSSGPADLHRAPLWNCRQRVLMDSGACRTVVPEHTSTQLNPGILLDSWKPLWNAAQPSRTRNTCLCNASCNVIVLPQLSWFYELRSAKAIPETRLIAQHCTNKSQIKHYSDLSSIYRQIYTPQDILDNFPAPKQSQRPDCLMVLKTI